jgi:hypothetical protein
VKLVHNKDVSYYEECLTLGQWLGQNDQRALYKYLVTSKRFFYESLARELLQQGSLTKTIANGELFFTISNSRATYRARKLNSNELTPVIREMKLSPLKSLNVMRLKKFIAQGDVDVIHNYPLPGANIQEGSGFGFNANPFYTLAYYSNGKNPLHGLINKLKTNDRELLEKLSR